MKVEMPKQMGEEVSFWQSDFSTLDRQLIATSPSETVSNYQNYADSFFSLKEDCFQSVVFREPKLPLSYADFAENVGVNTMKKELEKETEIDTDTIRELSKVIILYQGKKVISKFVNSPTTLYDYICMYINSFILFNDEDEFKYLKIIEGMNVNVNEISAFYNFFDEINFRMKKPMYVAMVFNCGSFLDDVDTSTLILPMLSLRSKYKNLENLTKNKYDFLSLSKRYCDPLNFILTPTKEGVIQANKEGIMQIPESYQELIQQQSWDLIIQKIQKEKYISKKKFNLLYAVALCKVGKYIDALVVCQSILDTNKNKQAEELYKCIWDMLGSEEQADNYIESKKILSNIEIPPELLLPFDFQKKPIKKKNGN